MLKGLARATLIVGLIIGFAVGAASFDDFAYVLALMVVLSLLVMPLEIWWQIMKPIEDDHQAPAEGEDPSPAEGDQQEQDQPQEVVADPNDTSTRDPAPTTDAEIVELREAPADQEEIQLTDVEPEPELKRRPPRYRANGKPKTGDDE